MLSIVCKLLTFVQLLSFIIVRIPVMVPQGIWWSNLMATLDFLSPRETSAFGLDCHDGRLLNAERRSSLPLVYHPSFDPAGSDIFSLVALETKNVQKAVAAVMMIAIFAATNCQYISQMESIESNKRPVLIPDIQVMVQMMVNTIRPRETDRANFWVHRIWIFHIRRNGMYKTFVYGGKKISDKVAENALFKAFTYSGDPRRYLGSFGWLTTQSIFVPHCQRRIALGEVSSHFGGR